MFAVIFVQSVHAADYYFSNAGNDARTASEARNPATPWKSIIKLNSIMASLKPGDRVLFKRGDIFYGKIRVTTSGTSSAPITYSAYGSGANPIISGFVNLTNWVNKGNGIYEVVNSKFPSCINMVTMNGLPKALGRWPNADAPLKGYMIAEAAASGTITDNELPSSPNWTGAELIVRTSHWTLDRFKVNTHVGTKLTFTQLSGTYKPLAKYGYFIQNHLRTLDKLGEWAYDNATKKLSMFFGSNSPANYDIQASMEEEPIDVYDADNVVFDNLQMEGGNENGIRIYSSNNAVVQNCEVRNSGIDGIAASITDNLKVLNNSIRTSHNIGIFLIGVTNNSLIRNNEIVASGLLAGMGPSSSNTSNGMRVNGTRNTVEYNVVDSSGYCGIQFTGDYTAIKNNLIRNFALTKDDAGGIYMTAKSGSTEVGRKIWNNIIEDGIGAKEGTNLSSTQQVSGIYLDNHVSGVDVRGNSVTRCGKVGIYIHNNTNITIENNTCFDNKAQMMLNHDDSNMPQLRNIKMKNNIFVSKDPKQTVAFFYTKVNDISSFGSIDSNYYSRPLDENVTIQGITYLYTSSQNSKNYSFDQWRGLYGHDRNSKKSVKTYASTVNKDEVFRYLVNATTSSKTFSLSGTYVDARNRQYSGSVSLEPYTSMVLMLVSSSSTSTTSSTTTNLAPVVKLTSPVSSSTYSAPGSIKVTASATDNDGSIVKVDFYAGTKLIRTEKVAPYTFTWSNVVAGTYSITAKAYDNKGKVATSSAVTVTVKSGTSSIVGNNNIEAMLPENEVVDQAQITLYPNPASSNINVRLQGNIKSGKAFVTISDASGRMVLKQAIVAANGTIVPLSIYNLPVGMYICNVIGEGFQYSSKFIKQ
ncbi:hypothetical protein BUE76_15470 [Cnuella takakiae]|nr:hypothetical protein BUE76_15470 [Cnuella takakiae]